MTGSIDCHVHSQLLPTLGPLSPKGTLWTPPLLHPQAPLCPCRGERTCTETAYLVRLSTNKLPSHVVRPGLYLSTSMSGAKRIPLKAPRMPGLPPSRNVLAEHGSHSIAGVGAGTAPSCRHCPRLPPANLPTPGPDLFLLSKRLIHFPLTTWDVPRFLFQSPNPLGSLGPAAEWPNLGLLPSGHHPRPPGCEAASVKGGSVSSHSKERQVGGGLGQDSTGQSHCWS